MRFIPSTEGPQVRDRQPGTYQGSQQAEIDALVTEAVERGVDTVDHPDLELSAGELIAEHTGNVSFLHHLNDGEVWGPITKLAELSQVASELEAAGYHRWAARIRQAIGLEAA